ncbi:MAG TPA: hypothetical protein VLW50_09210 [Streptosporangiaceae bacterium]|nr:hypothetical protein [Streptosporangiaceae bacterium]
MKRWFPARAGVEPALAGRSIQRHVPVTATASPDDPALASNAGLYGENVFSSAYLDNVSQILLPPGIRWRRPMDPVARGIPRVGDHKTAHRERPRAQIILLAARDRGQVLPAARVA